MKIIEEQNIRELLIDSIRKIPITGDKRIYILERSDIGSNIYTTLVWSEESTAFYDYRYIPSTLSFSLKVIDVDHEYYDYLKALRNDTARTKKCENNGLTLEVSSSSILSILVADSTKVVSVKIN